MVSGDRGALHGRCEERHFQQMRSGERSGRRARVERRKRGAAGDASSFASSSYPLFESHRCRQSGRRFVARSTIAQSFPAGRRAVYSTSSLLQVDSIIFSFRRTFGATRRRVGRLPRQFRRGSGPPLSRVADNKCNLNPTNATIAFAARSMDLGIL